MLTADFDYVLPLELIAQVPAPQRDQSRLLVLQRAAGGVSHRQFPAVLEYLHPGDVLVLNNSRVIPARLRGRNARTGGAFEIFLLEENARNDWWCLMKPGKRAPVGTEIKLTATITATVLATNAEGHRRLQFSGCDDIRAELDALGEIPLPPYIRRDRQVPADRERYQTIFAQPPGSLAAPTAGLHFTPQVLEQARARGVQVCFVTLHVGLGTFAPVKAATIAGHVMHEEQFEISAATASIINEAKAAGRRVFAVGTTCVRVLESVAAKNAGQLVAANDRTKIFIHPPYQFKVVDALLTNFHLPCSTLLMLVSAFAAPGGTRGRELVLAAYAEAIRERYRFFSYGDAMLIL
jgi:S-adenosylmethionine:tRNA ribosyltransferase-isomerase